LRLGLILQGKTTGVNTSLNIAPANPVKTWLPRSCAILWIANLRSRKPSDTMRLDG